MTDMNDPPKDLPVEDVLSLTGHQAFFSGRTIVFAPPPLAPSSEPVPVVDSDDNSDVFSAPENEGAFLLDFFTPVTAANETDDKNAFVTGMYTVFQTQEGLDEEAIDDDSQPNGPFDLSATEVFQQEEEERQRESLDGFIRQNDADTLFELGEKYDRHGEEPLEVTRPVEISPVSLLEAMLFVGDRENRALSLEKATSLMRNVSLDEAWAAIQTLNTRYRQNGSPYEITQDQEGWRFVLREEFEPVRERFFGKTREVKLSQKVIDVLALIAYRQPISLGELMEVRPNTGTLLTQLAKRDLIVQEKQTINGEQSVYFRTTARFLTLFNIASLDDLPIIDEIGFR